MRSIVLLFALAVLSLSCGGEAGEFGDMGAPCSLQAPCKSGFCYGPRDRSFCTSACMGDEDCIEGFICEVELGYQAKICLPGARCEGDDTCPSGHRCDPATKSCFVSVSRDLCGPCTSNLQCPTDGLCVHARSTGERFCSTPCDVSRPCPHGYVCRSLNQDGISYGGGDKPRQCIPITETCNARKPLCSPCEGDWECGSHRDLCLNDRHGDGRTCGRFCNPDCVFVELRDTFIDQRTGRECNSGCPSGFECLAFGELHQCVPLTTSCSEYCSATTPLEERMQCGLGMACVANRCVPAEDGRSCAPCDGGVCPSSGERDSVCLVNHRTVESFCASSCDSDMDCTQALGMGFSCRDVEGRRVCVPDSASCIEGVAPLGASCETGDACAGGVCLRFGERGMCSGSCSADEDCGDARWTCCARDEGGGGPDCSREPEAGEGICHPRGGGFGDVCDEGRPPCEGGYCLDIGTARICTESCESDDDCDRASLQSGAFSCRRARLEGSDDSVGVCFPAGGGEVGSDCTFGAASCSGRICLEMRLGNVCSMECDLTSDCPEGWKCDLAPSGDGTSFRVCLPG